MPTPIPTPTPTPIRWIAKLTVSLVGITAAQFDTIAQENFISEVASSAGSVCGARGTRACASRDVTIISFSRRTISITINVITYSQTKANTAAATLGTAMAAANFVVSLTARGGALALVTNVSVTSLSTSVHTPSSFAPDSGITTIIVVVVVIVVLTGVASAVCFHGRNAAPVAASESIDSA